MSYEQLRFQETTALPPASPAPAAADPARSRQPRLPSRRRPPSIQPSLLEGALAGFLGGLCGMGVSMLVKKVLPSRPEKTASPQDQHWIAAPLAAAVYGAAVEFEPQLTARHGAAFGLGLAQLGHTHLLPGLLHPGQAQPATHPQPPAHQWSSTASAVLFGVVTESVRRLIRGR